MFRSLLIVLGFGLLTLFPAWEWATGWLPDPPLDEKRLPAPEPRWQSAPSLNAYLAGWQDWFDDRYAGRNLLIRLKTQLDYSLFSYSDRIYIGREGWLFYRSVFDGEIQMQQSYTPAVVDRVIDEFRHLREWLQARGITLVLVDIPLKDNYYAAMLPASAPRLPSPSVSVEIRRRLGAETGAACIDAAGILGALQAERTIFHRTDFHWNDPAAFVVAQATVNRMARLAGNPALGWRLRLEIETRPNSGGEAAFMPLLRPVTEQSLFVKPTWVEAPADLTLYQPPFEYIRRLHSPHPPLLPPVVVMGDSFFDGMIRCGFCEHFSAVYRARIYGSTLQQVLLHLPRGTRFMLVEFIEPGIQPLTLPLDFAALDRAFPVPAAKAVRPQP
jgi:hypothetical protein